MVRFLVRRLLFIAVVSVFIVYVVNLGMAMARNSEAREPSYDVVAFSQEAWSETRQFFPQALRGDLGTYETDRGEEPVSGILRRSYINSMGLLLASLVVASVIGIYIGMVAALRKRATLSLLTITIIGISAPSFFVALLLQQMVIRYTAEYGRLLSVAGFGWDYEHMLLPVLVLSARPLAYLTRSSFISLNRIMEEDYIRTAFAKGLRRISIVNIHAMRNIAVPVLTAVGVSLRFSLSTLPVVEFFFGWPGLGLNLLEAINNRQTALVVALALSLGLTFQLVNLLLDVTYRLIDPRMRQEA